MDGRTSDALTWIGTLPLPVAAGAAILFLLAAACWTVYLIRRIKWPAGSVMVAAVGAALCTVYSGDTSWRFARDSLGMHDFRERLVMFAAAEVALLACAVMARANKLATTTEKEAGTPGVSGVMVWAIVGVQIIPAYAESGIVGGTVRAVFGPIMAGLLWHRAMGLEIKMVRPEALSTGLLAVIGRELRERLLSRLGLATRDRSAEQITRDRATARAVRLASHDGLGKWGKRRLAAAVARAQVGSDAEQRNRLMQQLAARRTAIQLTTVPLTAPWADAAPAAVEQPAIQSAAPAAIERADGPAAIEAPRPTAPLDAELAGLDPFDAMLRLQEIDPDATSDDLARIRGGSDAARDGAVPGVPEVRRPVNGTHVPALEVRVPAYLGTPPNDTAPEAASAGHAPGAEASRTRKEVHAEYVPDGAYEGGYVPDSDDQGGFMETPDPLTKEARTYFSEEMPPSVRRIKEVYRVGQPRAQRIRDELTGVK